MAEQKHEWWQKGVIYQIYPRSFADSNGDGVGDLRGVLHKLDYLTWLGVDAIWLSPIYPSPMADFGYDISDYCNVHPLFGTLEDFDELVAESHRRGLKVVLDFVPNHTSDEHPWFREARQSRVNPKRNWYIWRDPAPGNKPPNNWLSVFGGSAWEFDPTTRQYYYHAFLKQQPDLNWRNPDVRHAMHDVLRFWLDRGVDGFRVDVIWHIGKDPDFRDNPRNPDYQPGMNPHHEVVSTYEADHPDVHTIIKEMRQVLDAYPERMMVGEVYLPVERLVAYYGDAGGGLGAGVHMPFNFQLVTMAWNARTVADAVEKYEAALPSYGWPNWVLGNHDNHRIASRIGRAQARVAQVLLLTLRGTPTMYYGDEIGMHDVPIPPDRVQDPFEKRVPGLGLGRDPERTPMQWDASPHAGFTASAATPWLPVAEDFRQVNVAAQKSDADSMLSLTRELIRLRRAEPALSVGDYQPACADDDVFAYTRRDRATGRTFLVALNFGPAAKGLRVRDCVPPHASVADARIVLSTHPDRAGQPIGDALSLAGDEAVIVAL
jgi:alpha-glucosidase